MKTTTAAVVVSVVVLLAVAGIAYYTLAPSNSSTSSISTSTYLYTANIPCTLLALHMSFTSGSESVSSVSSKVPPVNLTATRYGIFCFTYQLQFDNYTSHPPSNLTLLVPMSFNPVKIPSGFSVLVQGSTVRLNYPGSLPNPTQFTLLLSPTETGTFEITATGNNVGEILVSVTVTSSQGSSG